MDQHSCQLIVAQLGARLHYAAAVALHRAGRLAGLATDLYIRNWQLTLSKVLPIPVTLRMKIRRYQADLPSHLVASNHAAWIIQRCRNLRNASPLETARLNDARAAVLAATTIRLSRSRPASAVYAFDTAALEIFQWASTKGLTKILEQCVAPRAAQERVLSLVMTANGTPVSQAARAAWHHLAAREQQEWELSDLILCPSDFVRTEVLAAGGPQDKLVVLPYGINPAAEDHFVAAQRSRTFSSRKMRVLFAGEVGIRKGVLEMAAAAAQLSPEEYEFIAAGRVNLTREERHRVEQSVKLLGSLPNEQLQKQYAAADIFLLPSHLEGSATVIYEALAWGLPVITTKEAGSVVQHEHNGFVGKAGDIQFIVRSLELLHLDKCRREQMGRAARIASDKFSINAYKDRLINALDNIDLT